MVEAFDFAGWVRLMVAVALGTVLGLGLGCSKQRRDGRREVVGPAPVVLNVPRVIDGGPPADASLAAAPGGTLLDLLADLDGDRRPERILLAQDGTLSVGAATLKLALTSRAPRGRVVALDDALATRHLLLEQETDDDEDPPTRYRLFRFQDGALTMVLDRGLGTYGRVELEIGDGGVAFVEDGWGACTRAQHPATPVARERVVLTPDTSGMLIERTRSPSGLVQDCNQLSACPFVYVGGAGQETLAGEILRNIRGRAMATTQGLELPTRSSKDGVLRVRLSEEKPEATHLDAIVAEVDGRTVVPLECAASGAARPAFCAADGSAHLMRQGDSLVLTFDVTNAGGEPGSRVELRATGYYVPIR
ncbi:MAG: hypothetical protein IT370_27565 [Deltaproteobacteria bacterium]|nr:hypothetical protein [Deltaproteobacteria bacterium]